MNDQISELILSELQALRKDVNNGFLETKQRLTAVETVTEPFFANDGGLSLIHEDINDLKRTKYYGLGFVAAGSVAINWLLRKFGV